MKDKWNKEKIEADQFKGQPVGLLYSFDSETWSRPSKAPSTRAIRNYNSISTATSNDEYVNYTFVGDDDFKMLRNTSSTLPSDYKYPRDESGMTDDVQIYQPKRGYSNEASYSAQQLSAESVASGFSETITSADSERTDFTAGGSTTKLVLKTSKLSRCWSWIPRLERGLSCVSLAACLGNISRLPLSVMAHGGAPFLVVYLLMLFLLGLPLVFLELGVGQIVQDGITKTWRAVPMFRGVGYVKLLANFIVCIYYPLHVGLALYYLVWLAKGSIPFSECVNVKIGKDGYRTVGISGDQCLNKTFLESPVNNPKWFGVYVGFLAIIWLIIMICSFRKIKAYMRSMNCFFLPTFACLITLLVKAIYHEIEYNKLKYFYEDIDWTILQKADIWYYALIQLFFSTHLGFGNVVTCAGKVYNKTDPFWAAFAYFLFNVILGILSVITCYILTGKSSKNANLANVTELYIFTVIYDNAGNYPTWSVIAYFTIFLSGFISLLAVVFTILKAIRVETKEKWKWWHITAFLCFIFFVLGAFSLLAPNFEIVHLFDHYVVGNLLLLSTFLEVGAFVCFYGCTNIYIDFEFILGSSLTWVWKFLWCLAPIILFAVMVWSLATMPLTGLFHEDPMWMYITGWSIVVLCLIFIIIVAVYEVYIQVDYNFIQKFSSALKASRKWGPVDPMLRHGWIQWRSTAGTGDRDFTLKRRGTRDYTHSVKNRREPLGTRYVSTTNISEATTLPGLSSPSYRSDQNENSVANNGQIKKHPLEVISITDTLERDIKPRILRNKKHHSDTDKYTSGPKRPIMNPLAIPSMYGDTATDSNSEGYGTIRHGPYVIGNGEFDHVCWRKTSLQEEATEL